MSVLELFIIGFVVLAVATGSAILVLLNEGEDPW